MTALHTSVIFTADEEKLLPDLLSVVLDLMPCHLLDRWPSHGAGIRSLRLVSKDIGSIALRAVTSCSVTLGEWQDPDPKKFALLMRGSQLQTLELNIVTYPGTPYPSPEQQLSSCMLQMASVLASMGTALHSVTHMNLVTFASPPNPLHSRWNDNAMDNDMIDRCFNPAFQADVSHVPAAVCAMLATAVPKLQHLSLWGVCVDVALATFGANCPQISSLKVEALLVPVSSLKGLDTWFPNLAHLTINTRGMLGKGLIVGPYNPPEVGSWMYMQHYIDLALPLLQGCSNLKVLHLDLQATKGGSVNCEMIRCSPQVWECLPPSLEEFSCDVACYNMIDAPSLLQRVRVLTLMDLFWDDLPEVLLHAPLLERYTVLYDDPVEITWGFYSTPMERIPCKVRLLNGFQLRCKSVRMSGSSEEIQDLMEWLSPLLETTACVVHIGRPVDAVHSLAFLGNLMRTCPALTDLCLYYVSGAQDSLPIQEEELMQLVAIPSLERLSLGLLVNFTTAGLMGLCTRLPSLCSMYFQPVEGVCCNTVTAGLKEQGRVIVFR